MKNIQQRKDTIKKVTEEIVAVQHEFFERGVKHLKPLTLREIAERVGMHESTVSRVTSNKFVETPRGVLPYRYFFSSGIESDRGETVASRSVKEMIRQMIDTEDKRKPLSDQKITNTLRDATVSPRSLSIRDKLRAAQWLVKNIQQRKDTIKKVTEEIVAVQHEFFERGVKHLKPLTLREIAERVGMHESTVSRVTSNKFVETPRGVLPYRYFFSSGIESDRGETVASRSVKEMIRQMIDTEDKRKPLSDQKITNTLNEQGINIARRTTAKYREELSILPSKYRREYAKK